MTRDSKTIFICGTDTGVGKTVITGALLAYLNQKGIHAGGFKPFESGCDLVGIYDRKPMRRHLKRADSEFLKKMAKMPEPLDIINPYYFREALAPGVAAERERVGATIRGHPKKGNHGGLPLLKTIRKSLKSLTKSYDIILIEGAGGLLVPLPDKKTSLDLIKYLKSPVLLIGRLGLGTLNHTLLTLEHLKRNRIKVIGVILNEITPKKTIAEKTNPDVLRKLGVPLLGVFPYVRGRSGKKLIRGVQKEIGGKLINSL